MEHPTYVEKQGETEIVWMEKLGGENKFYENQNMWRKQV